MYQRDSYVQSQAADIRHRVISFATRPMKITSTTKNTIIETMAAAALPVVSCSGITIAQQPLGQIHWKSTTTKLIVHSTIPFKFSVVALFFVGRGTIIIMSIHHHQRSIHPHHYHYNLCRLIRSEQYHIKLWSSLYSTNHYVHNNQSTDASNTTIN